MTEKRVRRPIAMLHAQIISSLQRGARARKEIEAEVDATDVVVNRFLNELRDLGVVYIKERAIRSQTNRTEIFALNATPFENSDVPKLTRHRRKETQ
jgi:hypothetical protein